MLNPVHLKQRYMYSEFATIKRDKKEILKKGKRIQLYVPP